MELARWLSTLATRRYVWDTNVDQLHSSFTDSFGVLASFRCYFLRTWTKTNDDRLVYFTTIPGSFLARGRRVSRFPCVRIHGGLETINFNTFTQDAVFICSYLYFWAYSLTSRSRESGSTVINHSFTVREQNTE